MATPLELGDDAPSWAKTAEYSILPWLIPTGNQVNESRKLLVRSTR